jgi:GT2 family glycosyltransferase
MMSSQVTAVVLNWNGKEDTLECLGSLSSQQGVALSTVVVDNGSTDDSVSAIRERFPELRIIENQRNLGYSEGNNVGIRYALEERAEYILVINNDTVLDKSCLARLVVDLQDHSSAAAAAPKSLLYDRPDCIYFAGGRIDSEGNTDHIGGGQPDGPLYGESLDTQWLTGCAILFRASALESIGLFDPDYYLLCEDVDWSLRARRAGYSLRFVAAARLWHKVSSSFGEAWNPSYLYYYTRNYCLFIERNFENERRVRLCYRAVKRSWKKAGRRSALRRAVALGAIDYLLRRFGARAYR